jgi:hypothetical protein
VAELRSFIFLSRLEPPTMCYQERVLVTQGSVAAPWFAGQPPPVVRPVPAVSRDHVTGREP